MTAVRRLRDDVVALATAEGRKPGTLGHRRAEHYLVERLHTIGLRPYRGDSFRLPFGVPEAPGGGAATEGMNLAAVVAGSRREAPPLLLGAHYDSVLEAPCADDNAAAVAIVLEVALELVSRPLTRDVVVALFDTEESPYTGTPAMGSLHFHGRQMDERGIACAVIQDLTGHDVRRPARRPAAPPAAHPQPPVHDRSGVTCGTGTGGGGVPEALAAAFDRDPQPLHRRRQRPPAVSPCRAALPVLLLRPLGTLSPGERHPGAAQLPQDAAHRALSSPPCSAPSTNCRSPPAPPPTPPPSSCSRCARRWAPGCPSCAVP